MKPTRSLLFALAAFAASSLSAQTTYTIQEAVAQGKIRARIDCQGGSRNLILRFERIAEAPLRISMAAGQLFVPADTGAQTLVAVKEETFTLTQKQMFLRVKSYCSEAGDRSPSAQESFEMGSMAAAPLQKLAEYISKNKLYDHPDVQTAVWCVANGLPAAGIGHKGLLQTACQLSGQPLPTYQIKTAPIVERPGRRIEPPPPLSIEGVFEYETKTDCSLSLYVFNDKNERVKTFYENKQHPPSKIKYTFSWTTTKMPRGEYEVRLLDGDRLVKRMMVRY